MSTKLKQAGFSVVEALLAATVFGILVTALAGAFVYGHEATVNAGDHQQATYLAEEGVEAVRSIANAAYSNLTDGTYGLVSSGGQWTLSGTLDKSGVFTRQITIAAAGTNRKAITTTVTWPQGHGDTGTVTLTSRISNWEAALAVPKSWTNAILSGSADGSGTTDGLKVATAGDYAYVVRNTTSANFLIVNISNPAAPSIVSTTTVTGTPSGIAVSGTFAYITTTTASGGLRIYNVSTPATPSLTRTVAFTGTGAVRNIFISGNYAYAVRASDTTTGANEFNIIDITTPASASVVGGYNNNIQMNDVYVAGNFAYVATSSTTAEMLVVNVTTKTAPTLGATYNPATALAALSVHGAGNTIFLGMSTTLDAINVTTPTSPVRLGTFTAAGTINNIETDPVNGYAFLGTSATAAEFQIVNIATPASMSLVKSVDVSGTTSTINGVAYSSTYDIVVAASAFDTGEVLVFSKN